MLRLLVSTALIFLVLPVSIYSTYQVTLISSKFMGILVPSSNTSDPSSEPDQSEFWTYTLVATGLVLFRCLSIALNYYVQRNLYLQCRRYFTKLIMRDYMNKNNFYKVKLDNPDQRIAQDLDKLALKSSKMLFDFLDYSFSIVWYTWKTLETATPVMLVVIFVYAAVGIITNTVILPFQIKQSQKVEKAEGNYRYQQIRITKSAEAIALSRAAQLEGNLATKYLKALLSDQRVLLHWETLVWFISSIFSYAGSIIAYIVVSQAVFAGDLGDMTPSEYVTKYVAIVMTLIYNLTRLLSFFQDGLGTMLGWYKRVVQLYDALDRDDYDNGGPACWPKAEVSRSDSEPMDKSSLVLALENKDIQILSRVKAADVTGDGPGEIALETTPFSSSLDVGGEVPVYELVTVLKNVSFDLQSKSVLIQGPSGIGKTSIIRNITGLIENKPGNSPTTADYLVIPQNGSQTIMPDASWMEQIAYPRACDFTEATGQSVNQLLTFLELLPVGLSAGELNEPRNHWNELSGGEIQRVLLARVLFQKPKYAVLDEAFSSLDAVWRGKIFKELRGRDIYYLTVAHDVGYDDFHDEVIQL